MVKTGKRAPSAWNLLVKKTYKEGLKKDKNYTLGNAMRDASNARKHGGKTKKHQQGGEQKQEQQEQKQEGGAIQSKHKTSQDKFRNLLA